MTQRRSGNRNVDRIEEMFRREKELREAVLEGKLGARGHTGGEGTGHSRVSDPTPVAALRRAVELNSVTLEDGTRVLWPERWLAVIGAVRAWCGNDTVKAEIFRRRYGVGEANSTTCRALHIENNVYYYLLREIRFYALACAAQEQIILVF